MGFAHSVRGETYRFDESPARSGDELAGVAASDASERRAAQMALADPPLRTLLNDVTRAQRIARTDAERNCISSVRPDGLSPAIAASKLLYLVREARSRGLTGVPLKDETAMDGATIAQASSSGAISP